MGERGGRTSFERRALLKGALGSSVLGFVGCDADLPEALLRAEQALRAGRSRVFQHGVASGDPLYDRVVLWTRVTKDGVTNTDDGNDDDVPVRYEVALDPAFANVVTSGTAVATAARDFTVKVDPVLPRDGCTYYYRFEALGVVSPVGRTRTASRAPASLRLAVASCSSIWSGFFNAYDRIADRNDLDLVVHCGDYVYDEVDPDEKLRMPESDLDTQRPVDLAGMRRRYAYYRLDPALRRAHQQHPFSIVWDNHDLGIRGDRAEAIRAFHEWTPTRAPEPGREERIHRALSFGSLADVVLLDGRHIGRDTPIDPSRPIDGTKNRSMLGSEQLAWLDGVVEGSTARYRIFVNQVMLAPFKLFGRPLATNMWDGYEDDRARLLAMLARHDKGSNLFVTGDAHMAFASRLSHEGREVCMEFLPTSVTRGNVDEELGKALGTLASLGMRLLPVFNPHFVYTEFESHGYGIVDVDENRVATELWFVRKDEPSRDERLAVVLEAPVGSNRLERAPGRGPSRGRWQAEPAPAEAPLFPRSEAVGGAGGTFFDDERALPLLPRVERLAIRTGSRVDAVEVQLSSGLRLTHGGTGGSARELTLTSDDALVAVEVGAGRKDGADRIFFVRFETRSGRVLEGGTRPRSTQRFTAPPGFGIVGFHGKAGDELDRLGVLFAPA